MFEVHFYENKQGEQPVRKLLDDLWDRAKTSKDARINTKRYLPIFALCKSMERG